MEVVNAECEARSAESTGSVVDAGTERGDSEFSNPHSALPTTLGRLRDFSDDPLACMFRLRAEHGDISALEEGPHRLVFAFGPEFNRRILTDTDRFHSRFFVMRGSRRSAQRRITGGLLSMNGGEHKAARRSVAEPFQKRSIGRYHERIVGLTNELLDGWSVGDVVDVHRVTLDFMLRLTTSILFGVDDPDLAIRIGEKLDGWMRLNHATGMGAFVDRPNLGDDYDELMSRAEDVERELRELIAVRRRDTSGGDVLSLLLESFGSDGGDQFVGQVALMFGAAHLTTAHTLAWTLFLLAQHPEIAVRCRDEASAAADSDTPDAGLADRCPLMGWVLKESMRILPASAYVHRVVAEPVELGPFRLSRGTPVVWSQFVTHHMPEVFPAPNRFDPDRWLTASPSPYEYLPYGAGPRMCLGGSLATRILGTVLPLIVRRFRPECMPGTNVEPRVVSTTLGPDGPLPMRLRAPEGSFRTSPVTGTVHDYVDLPRAEPARRAA